MHESRVLSCQSVCYDTKAAEEVGGRGFRERVWEGEKVLGKDGR